MQQFLQFIILTFIYSSTSFGCRHAHHQEPNNCSSSLWFYLRIVVIAVLLFVYYITYRSLLFSFKHSWFPASWFNVNKGPTRCNSMQTFIHCHVTLHVSGVTAPIIRSTINCICYLHNTRSHQSGSGPRWKEVTVPLPWHTPEVADTVFSTPDDGCCDTRNM